MFSRLRVVHQLLFNHGLVHEILDFSGLESFHSVPIETALSFGVSWLCFVEFNCFSTDFDANLGRDDRRIYLFLLAILIYTRYTSYLFDLSVFAFMFEL